MGWPDAFAFAAFCAAGAYAIRCINVAEVEIERELSRPIRWSGEPVWRSSVETRSETRETEKEEE